MAKSEDSVAGRDGEPSKQQEETEKIDKQKSVDESESKDEDASASDDEAEDEFDFSFSYEPFYFSSASDRQVGVDLMWEAFNHIYDHDSGKTTNVYTRSLTQEEYDSWQETVLK